MSRSFRNVPRRYAQNRYAMPTTCILVLWRHGSLHPNFEKYGHLLARNGRINWTFLRNHFICSRGWKAKWLHSWNCEPIWRRANYPNVWPFEKKPCTCLAPSLHPHLTPLTRAQTSKISFKNCKKYVNIFSIRDAARYIATTCSACSSKLSALPWTVTPTRDEQEYPDVNNWYSLWRFHLALRWKREKWNSPNFILIPKIDPRTRRKRLFGTSDQGTKCLLGPADHCAVS